jgi:hypothetical protein
MNDFGFDGGGIACGKLSAEDIDDVAGGGLIPEREFERRDKADGRMDFDDGDGDCDCDCDCDFKEGVDLDVDMGEARVMEDRERLGDGEELLREGTSCSMDMLSIELDLARPLRGELLLDMAAPAEAEGGEGEVVLGDLSGGGDDGRRGGIDAAIVAGVMVDVLLCFGRCCGRDVTLNDEGGRRSRIGVGTILSWSGTRPGDGGDSTTGGAGAGSVS